MAHMHPSRLTDAFSASRVPSEKRVYLKALEELPNQYHVFHDFLWDDPSLDEAKTAGQIDFVVVEPGRGFVTLEVKGGRCCYEPELRSWSSIDRHGESAEITDPFDQAAVASRVILKLLLRNPNLSRAYLPHHHAVIFPDCVLDKRDLRANVKGWQILDQESLFNLRASTKTLFDYAFPKGALEPRIGQALIAGVRALWGGRELEGKELVTQRVREISDQLIRLTDDQLTVLRMCQDHRFCLIQGCAGSGKTTLAVHKAKLLAESGKNVLLVCFNQPLGEHLKKLCEGCERIMVGPFLELCMDWLNEAGSPLTRKDASSFWEDELPNAFTTRFDYIKHRFDAIVVDEGQDFKENHWLMLEMLLSDPTEAYFYIFSDGLQNIYRGSGKYPVKTMPIKLLQNVRNTNQIFSVVKSVCDLPEGTKPSGVNGPAVSFASYSDDNDMHAHIDGILRNLIQQGFRGGDIVLLGTKSQKRTSLRHGQKIGQFRMVGERHEPADLLTMTVHRFKGLESPVVILCELDESLLSSLEEVLYVGLTRPIAYLYVLYHGEFKSTLLKRGLPIQ